MKRLLGIIVILAIVCAGFVALHPISNRIEPTTFDRRVRSAIVDTYKGPLKVFLNDIGRYPTTEEGLDALIICPAGLETKWKGPYYHHGSNLDPWGRSYKYRSFAVQTKPEYEIWSLGPKDDASGREYGKVIVTE